MGLIDSLAVNRAMCTLLGFFFFFFQEGDSAQVEIGYGPQFALLKASNG